MTDSLLTLSDDDLRVLQGPDVVAPLIDESSGKQGHTLAPCSVEQVARLLHLASEKGSPLSLTRTEAFGLEKPLWLNLEKLTAVESYRKADLTLKVQTGIRMGDLEKLLAAEGHWFPLQYPPETRLCDVLAEDLPTLETGVFGYPRDVVLGVELVTPDGAVTRYGREVVKNVTGYDLNKLYVGSCHTLGVLTSAILRLQTRPETFKTWIYEFSDEVEALEKTQNMVKLPFPLTRCELFQVQRLITTKQKPPWQLLLQVAGDPVLMDGWMALIHETLSSSNGGNSNGETACPLRSLDAAHEQSLFQALAGWLNPEERRTLVVELALPMGALSRVVYRLRELLDALPQIPSPDWQIRYAAGLVYLIWPEGSQPKPNGLLPFLEPLSAACREAGGFLQLLRFPPSWLPLAETFNLPAETVQRDLLSRIKQTYDPRGILFSSRLPLSIPEGGLGNTIEKASGEGPT